MIVVLASIFSLYCLLSERRSVAIVAIAALTTGAAIQLASCIIIIFFGRRYTIPLHLLALMALCLGLAAAVEGWERRYRVLGSEPLVRPQPAAIN